MRIFDESHINEPCIGVLIEEKCSVGQFLDNCIYVIADENSPLAEKAMSLTESFNKVKVIEKEEFFNDYDLEVVQNVELTNHPKIKERIDRHGDNILIQLNAYSDEGKKFVVAKTDENRLWEDLFLMVHAAERIAKRNVEEILKAFAKDDTDEFVDLARYAIRDERFLMNCQADLAEESAGFCYGIAPSASATEDGMEARGGFRHRQIMEMYDRFLDNLKRCHKHLDPEVEREIDIIIKQIDPATLKRFFLKLSPKLLEKICSYINPRHMAEVSTVDLEVRKMSAIDKKEINGGQYCLFLKRGCETLMVHFTRRAGFILYLIYLLDRKKNGDKVDTLKLEKYKVLFGRLFEMVYGYNGENVFTDIMKNFNANGDMRQKGLYTVLNSIRNDVGSTCERMLEPAEPFMLRNIKSHLAVLPEHIILPPEMMAIDDVKIS